MPELNQFTLYYLIILFGSIALHEFGHAKSADAAGDPTPRMMGRVTLNPAAHFDPLGAFMIVVLAIYGVGIGWGKPVMTNPSKMQNPRSDAFMSVLWGPLTNIIIAVVCALLLRFLPGIGTDAALFLFLAVLINVSLAIFNLIPLGPLDGHWLLGYMLPERMGAKFILWSKTQGTFILLAIIILEQTAFRGTNFSILGTIIGEPSNAIVSVLTGVRMADF